MGLLPDLDELVVLRGAARDLEMRIRQPAASQLQGAHRSAHRGRGLEFDEVRVYAPGDDARTIDWRVTARRGRPHTKLFREERERQVWLLADLHPGLYFGSRRQLKSAQLLRAAAWLAWVAVDAGDRLGGIITHGSSAPEALPPRSRDIGALALLQALVQNQPRAPGPMASGALGKALTTLRPLLRPGSSVVVLSDFSDFDDAGESALVALSMRAECRVVWLTDPLERQGLPAGAYRVGVPGRLWSLDGAASRGEWSAAWAERERRVDSLCLSRRLPLLRLDTGDDLAQRMPAFISESR